jgi:FkbM family methyltransferase
MIEALNNLKSAGFEPKTIIDAGVASGTPPLYKVFPNSYYYLFEPIKEFSPHIFKILKKHKGEHCPQALSDEDGKAYISPGRIGEDNSTRTWEHPGCTMGWKDPKESRLIEQVKLDTFFKDKTLSGPILLKTDLQGHDLQALKGGRNLLKLCEAVITEISFQKQSRREKTELKDFMSYLSQEKFICVDIFSPLRRENQTLMQVDGLFIKENSPPLQYWNK